MAAPPFLPESIWADFNAALNPLLGAKQPDKAEIRALIRWMLDALDALSSATGSDLTAIAGLRVDLLKLSARIDTVIPDQLVPLGFDPNHESDWDMPFKGKNGNVFGGIKDGDFQLGFLGSSFEARMAARDAENLARSRRITMGVNARIARIHADYNLLLLYSQSLGVGMEGWPALSKAALMLGGAPACYMVGNSIRCADDNAQSTPSQWVPVGGAQTLNPLIATVENGSGTILTDAAVAALPAGDTAVGENPFVGAANYLARAHYDMRGYARSFVAMSAGTSGKSLAELSPGANPNLYGRFTGALAAFKAAVGTKGSIGCPAIGFMQGEFDYLNIQGGDPTYAGYLAKLTTLRNQMVTDVMASTGQARPPAFFMYQTGGSYTRDGNQMAVGRAQWDFSRSTPGVYMFGPTYPVTDKYGHLDANGYRWVGQQIGKVMQRVLIEGQGWEPLSPLWIRQKGSRAYLGYHVPAGNLVFDKPFSFYSLQDYEDKGFVTVDKDGLVPVKSIAIISNSVIRIEYTRTPDPATALIYYAPDNGHGGNGCVRDTDPTVANDDYTYTAGSGQYAFANQADYVGKPYPLFNWSIAFCLPMNWSR